MNAVLTVWCAECGAEGRSSPAKLGWLDDEGYWHRPRDRRRLRAQDHRLFDGGRREVSRSAEPAIPQGGVRAMLERRGHRLPPAVEWLPVRCPVHGEGSVSARGIVGKRGSVELHIITATA